MVVSEVGAQPSIEARQRYEAARERLTDAFGDRVRALVGVSPQALMIPEDAYTHRAAVIEAGMDLVVPLRRFVERELYAWVDPEIAASGAIEVDDVVADTYLAAVDQAGTAPVARAFYTWLRRIARREVRKAVLANEERERVEQSIFRAVPVYDEEWPEEVLALIDMLADPRAELPEDVLERVETRDVIAGVMTRLPEQWREIFLMRVVDGWVAEDVATFEGIDPREVEWKVAMSRELLRSWLEEARDHGAGI